MTACVPGANTARAILRVVAKWVFVITVTFLVGREICRHQAVSWDQVHFVPKFRVFSGLSMCANSTMMVTAYCLPRLKRLQCGLKPSLTRAAWSK